MKLVDLLQELEHSVEGNASLLDKDIVDIVYDSRKATADTLFVAIPGETVDGHDYLPKASDLGCRVFVVERVPQKVDEGLYIQVNNSRSALSTLSATFFCHPSQDLKVVGITGTKGKTTISTMLKQVVEAMGYKTGVIGTNGIYYDGRSEATINTTPESYILQKTLRNMVESDVAFCFIEVSSTGLKMSRVQDVQFALTVFTNLYPDHIGPKEHADFEEYAYYKSTLFSRGKFALFNREDPHWKTMAAACTSPYKTFGMDSSADIHAENETFSTRAGRFSTRFTYVDEKNRVEVQLTQPGHFNVLNALCVLGCADYLDLALDEAAKALTSVEVEGRAQVLPLFEDRIVLLDYAHNGMAMEGILDAVRYATANRLLVLFGSVGERTQLRRRELGDVVAAKADIAIITSDNPDHEDPMTIIEDIAKSFDGTAVTLVKEPDREIAIDIALSMMAPGDVLVLAGKGHEQYQIINGEKIPFNEREIATRLAKQYPSSLSQTAQFD